MSEETEKKIIALERVHKFYELLKGLIEGYVNDVQNYIDSRGYMTEEAVDAKITQRIEGVTPGENVDLSGYATEAWVGQQITQRIGNAKLVLKDYTGNILNNRFTANKSEDTTVELPTPVIIIKSQDNKDEKDTDESTAEKDPAFSKTSGSIELKFWATGRTQTFNVYMPHIMTPESISGGIRRHNIAFYIDLQNVDWHQLTGITPSSYGRYSFYARGANSANRMFGQDVRLNNGMNMVDMNLSQTTVNGTTVNGMAWCVAHICFDDTYNLAALQSDVFGNFRGHLTLRNNP